MECCDRQNSTTIKEVPARTTRYCQALNMKVLGWSQNLTAGKT